MNVGLFDISIFNGHQLQYSWLLVQLCLLIPTSELFGVSNSDFSFHGDVTRKVLVII